VFDHWRSVHGHQAARIDAKRASVINSALALYSADKLCESISGYQNSPHHMGRNDRGTKYDDITLMLRDATHIDAGLKFFDEPPDTDGSEKWRKSRDTIGNWSQQQARSEDESD